MRTGARNLPHEAKPHETKKMPRTTATHTQRDTTGRQTHGVHASVSVSRGLPTGFQPTPPRTADEGAAGFPGL